MKPNDGSYQHPDCAAPTAPDGPDGPDCSECEVEDGVLTRMSHALYVKTVECCVGSTVLVLMFCVCLLCYFYCIPCLLGIVAVSLCLCPFLPYFNLPRWISIVILVMSGYRLTNGHLSLVWE